jgi:hypothetical protein
MNSSQLTGKTTFVVNDEDDKTKIILTTFRDQKTQIFSERNHKYIEKENSYQR